MLLLWVLVLGVCGDVVLSMEGPRGKVTREMCSQPASQVPEEHWPYCCEGYGNHCEDFAASCYLDCQPVVSSGSDVTLVEERPGFCCALYNFCCSREFARIGGNVNKVQDEEQFPTFHRFHVPGKQAPRWSPAPSKNIVRQNVKNYISETTSTVNRVGRPRTSRNNGNRERQDRIISKSSKSLDENDNEFSFDLRRSEQQQSRSNSQPSVIKPQRSSNPNVIKPQRKQIRFPQRPQTDETKNNEAPITSEITTTDIIPDDSLGKTAPTKKTEIKGKNIENGENNKNINANAQQLNSEAENREITLNRAGANHKNKLSNTNVNIKATNEDNEELTATNQPKSVSPPTTNANQPKMNDVDNSENKQVKKEKAQRVTTEQPTARRQNNGQKVKTGRRVLVRTAPKKIGKAEQEISKSIDSVQTKSGVNPTPRRRTLISNRQTPKTIRNNEQEKSKSSDSVQIRKDTKPTSGRRTSISNRQSSKKISGNEQKIAESVDSVQNGQDLKSITSRRTILSNRQNTKNINNNEQQKSKSVDLVHSGQKLKPIASKRPNLRNRQNTKKISTNEQEISKSTDSVQSREELKPTTRRRTIIKNRQTGSRRSQPTVSGAKNSTKIAINQEESNASNIYGGRNRGGIIKQTVRIVSQDSAQKESVKLDTSTNKELNKVLPIRRVSIKNKPVTEQIASRVSNIEKKDKQLKMPQNDQTERTSDIKIAPLNTNETTSHLPLSKEGVEAPKLDLDSSASQINEDHKINQNNFKISEQEKSRDETETNSPQELYENTAVTEAYEITQSPLEIENINKINKKQKEIASSTPKTINPKQTRTRSQTTISVAVTNSRNEDLPSMSEIIATTDSRSRIKILSSSKTRIQDPTLKEESISTTTTDRGAIRSRRIESFGSEDDSKSPVQKSPIDTENTPRRATEIASSTPKTINPKQTRTRSRTTIPVAVTNSRNEDLPSMSEIIAITDSRSRIKILSSSKTRIQDSTLKEETISTTTTDRGAIRSRRI